jgi:hypothetical protein
VELPLGDRMRQKGVLMMDAIGCVLLFGCLLVGAHIALVKFWNQRLGALQNTRIKYDGVKLWKPY